MESRFELDASQRRRRCWLRRRYVSSEKGVFGLGYNVWVSAEKVSAYNVRYNNVVRNSGLVVPDTLLTSSEVSDCCIVLCFVELLLCARLN